MRANKRFEGTLRERRSKSRRSLRAPQPQRTVARYRPTVPGITLKGS